MDHKEVNLSKEDLDIKMEQTITTYNERFSFVSFVGFIAILYGVMAIIIMHFNDLGFDLLNVVIILFGFAILGIQYEFTKKDQMIEKLKIEQRKLHKAIEHLEESTKRI